MQLHIKKNKIKILYCTVKELECGMCETVESETWYYDEEFLRIICKRCIITAKISAMPGVEDHEFYKVDLIKHEDPPIDKKQSED